MIFFAEICLLLLLLIVRPKGRIQEITVSIFNIMWLGGLAFSNLGFYELYKPSLKTNGLFVVTIIVFNIIYSAVSLSAAKQHANKMSDECSGISRTCISIRYLLVVNFVVLLVCLLYIPRAWSIYQTKGMSYLRMLVYIQSNEYFSNIYISLLFQWIIQPFLQFVLLVMASQINNLKNNKDLLIISIIDLAVEMLIFGGGRRTIIMFALQIIIFYLLKNQSKIRLSIKIKSKKLWVLVGVGLIAYIIILVTYSRLTKMSVEESFFQYYVGPFIFFDKFIKSGAVTESYSMGLCTFSFIIVPINMLLMILSESGYSSSAAQTLNASLNNVIYIGKHSVHNAHATSLIYFYSDFGPQFCFLGMIFFAVVIGLFTKRYKQSNRAYLLGVYFSSLTFFSAQTYPFTSVIQYIIIACSILFIR